jgi:hypothetical protein
MSSHEYNQLLKFLYFEGYADSYAEAEELLESMSDEEFEELLEKHSFPLKPSERRSVENIGRMLRGDYSVPPRGSTRNRSAKKVEPKPKEQPKARKRTTDLTKVYMGEEFGEIEEAKDIPQEVALKLADMLKGSPQFSRRGGIARGLRQYAIGRNKKRLEKLQQNEEFDAIVEYLFVEGFADTIEGAEEMAENISENWVNEILNEMEVQPPREQLKTDRKMFTISQEEQDAARKRALEKAKAMRAKKGIE